MKKTFAVQETNKKPDRQYEGFKHEIKKYLARERRKDLPEGFDFWDFNCRVGVDEASAATVHLKELSPHMDKLYKTGDGSFYVEILAHARKRLKK